MGTDIRQNAILAMCQYMTALAAVRLGDPARAGALLEAAATALEPQLAGGTLDKRVGFGEVMHALGVLHPDRACSLLQRASDGWHSWTGAPTPFVQREQRAIDRDVAAACRKTP
jgi:hypothetical protein